jgi:DNA-binding IclR family transcriptional regulator
MSSTRGSPLRCAPTPPAPSPTAVKLRRTLADVRKLGYAVSDRQIEDVSASVAALVRGPSGTVDAALSIVIPSSLDARQYIPALVTAAR